MSTPLINPEHFQPIHSAHSIEQAVFVLHFDRPITPEAFQSLINVAHQFMPELPGGGFISGVALALGAVSIQDPVMPQPPITGILMNRSAPDGSLESELRLEQASMSFRTTRYSRWSAIWGSAQRYFGAALGLYLDTGAQLRSISLNFVDKFVWHGEINNCDISRLLRTECEYMTPHIFDRRDLWHVHSGAFERSDQHTKRLVNVNIDCLDEIIELQPRRVILITSILTDIFGQPGFEPIKLTSNAGMAFIAEHMSTLHAFDKKILRNTIVESMSQKIALDD